MKTCSAKIGILSCAESDGHESYRSPLGTDPNVEYAGGTPTTHRTRSGLVFVTWRLRNPFRLVASDMEAFKRFLSYGIKDRIDGGSDNEWLLGQAVKWHGTPEDMTRWSDLIASKASRLND